MVKYGNVRTRLVTVKCSSVLSSFVKARQGNVALGYAQYWYSVV